MLEIFVVAHLATNNELLTLTLILNIIGQYDVKHIMTFPKKKVLTNIGTIRLSAKLVISDIVCFCLQSSVIILYLCMSNWVTYVFCEIPINLDF